MANKQNRYAPEFRRQMVELVRTGRSPAELSREFGPAAWKIALWVKQASWNWKAKMESACMDGLGRHC